MWYFAYGSNLNARAVNQWSRHFGHKAPPLKTGKPAVLDNYRLCFSVYSEYWSGGVADIVYEAGKYVMGVLFEVSDAELAVLDAKVGRKMQDGQELGVYKRIEISVAPLGRGEPLAAVTYQAVTAEKYHVPPTQHYMDLLLAGAYAWGLSQMWIAYLQSFSTQEGRKPRPGHTC